MTEAFLSGQSGSQENEEGGPPLDWYIGIGNPESGVIGYVAYAPPLTQLDEGKVGRALLDWHFQQTLYLGTNRFERIAYKKRMGELGSYIQQITGFSPEEIAAKRSALEGMLRGQSAAPFAVKLG